MPPDRQEFLQTMFDLTWALQKKRAMHFFPGLPMPKARDLALVLLVTVRLQFRRIPTTLPAISRRTQIPRSTLQRHMRSLRKMGWIYVRGRHYCVEVERLLEPENKEFMEMNARLIVEAAKKLTKMGSVA